MTANRRLAARTWVVVNRTYLSKLEKGAGDKGQGIIAGLSALRTRGEPPHSIS